MEKYTLGIPESKSGFQNTVCMSVHSSECLSGLEDVLIWYAQVLTSNPDVLSIV
jgi:hypothetical protein